MKYKNDKIVLTTLKNELKDIVELSTRNLSYLAQELAVLAKDQTVIVPIEDFSESIWSLLRFNLPSEIIKNDKLLKSIAISFNQVHRINGIISAREAYRIHNGAMSNYSTRVRVYDESLTLEINRLVASCNAAIAELEEKNGRYSPAVHWLGVFFGSIK